MDIRTLAYSYMRGYVGRGDAGLQCAVGWYLSAITELWSAVRQITGRTCQAPIISGIDADAFNSHYANVSTDPNYTTPSLKLTAASVAQ